MNKQCCKGEESYNHSTHKKARREMEEALILGVMIMKEQPVDGITMRTSFSNTFSRQSHTNQTTTETKERQMKPPNNLLITYRMPSIK
jgi:hypothetical protein